MMASSPADIPSKKDKNSSPKKDRSLVEAELVSSVAWLIRLRWLAGVGVLLASALVGVIFPFRIACSMTYQLSTNLGDGRMERNRKRVALIILVGATRKEDVTDEKMVD